MIYDHRKIKFTNVPEKFIPLILELMEEGEGWVWDKKAEKFVKINREIRLPEWGGKQYMSKRARKINALVEQTRNEIITYANDLLECLRFIVQKGYMEEAASILSKVDSENELVVQIDPETFDIWLENIDGSEINMEIMNINDMLKVVKELQIGVEAICREIDAPEVKEFIKSKADFEEFPC